MEEAIIQFDNVKIGSEIHLRYELNDKPAIGMIFSTAFAISNRELAKKENYTYISEVPLLTLEEDFAGSYTLKKTNSPNQHKIFIEPTAYAYGLEGKHELIARIYMTTSKSWSEVREQTEALFNKVLSRKLPKEYLKIAVAAKALPTTKETFNRVAEELNKLIAYSGDWQTRQGRYAPKIMQAVAVQGKGDCKDYATAMVAILRNLGYDANPFLTFRSNSFAGIESLTALSKIPSPTHFNHVIVHVVDKDKKTWWIDPTNPFVQADNVTIDILGNFGLLLDGKSTQALFLPSQNPQPADFTLEQTLTISGDNQMTGTGFTKMTPSSYNSLAMVKRLYGKEGLAKLYSFILNPSSKTTQLQIQESQPRVMRFDYSFHTSDWVVEQPKVKAISAFHPLGLHKDRLLINQNVDLGEIGQATYLTKIKGQKVLEPQRNHCLIRSDWIDADRVVTNSGGDIIVKDTIKTKKRFISKVEAHGEIYEKFLDDVGGCTETAGLLLKLDDSLKTAEYLQKEKDLGPSLDVMTDLDADRLFDLQGPSQTQAILLKLVRYYEKKLATQPKDSQAYYRTGFAMARLGYIMGDLYVPEHLKLAIENIDRSLNLAPEENEPRYTDKKIKYLLLENNLSAAMESFNRLNKKWAKHFYTYMAAAKIAQFQKNPKIAEQWLTASESLAKTTAEKIEFHGAIQDLLSQNGRSKEAIPHQEFIAKNSAKNAWAWHNLAALYMNEGNFDKAIEMDMKALEISEFGMARKVISDAYYRKYKKTVLNAGRNPASLKGSEELLMSSLKYNARNLQALGGLALHYANEFQQTHEPITLSKGRSYLDQATQVDPKNQGLTSLMSIYQSLEKK